MSFIREFVLLRTFWTAWRTDFLNIYYIFYQRVLHIDERLRQNNIREGPDMASDLLRVHLKNE